MNQKLISIEYTEYNSVSEMEVDDASLFQKAIQALEGSYAPYSKFNVGAAVLLSNGKVIQGSNQENAAYPSGTCAERVALFYANATYPNETIQKIAIVASSNGTLLPTPTYPCGACRQVMAEFEQRAKNPLEIIVGSSNTILKFKGVASLLPFAFDNLQ